MNVTTARPSLTPTEKRAAACFSEISLLAIELREELRWTPDTYERLDDTEAQHVSLMMNRIRDAIAKAGYLADLGSQQLGAEGRASAAGWLLAPVHAEAFHAEERHGGEA